MRMTWVRPKSKKLDLLIVISYLEENGAFPAALWGIPIISERLTCDSGSLGLQTGASTTPSWVKTRLIVLRLMDAKKLKMFHVAALYGFMLPLFMSGEIRKAEGNYH
jgi:hypothetical protein